VGDWLANSLGMAHAIPERAITVLLKHFTAVVRSHTYKSWLTGTVRGQETLSFSAKQLAWFLEMLFEHLISYGITGWDGHSFLRMSSKHTDVLSAVLIDLWISLFLYIVSCT